MKHLKLYETFNEQDIHETCKRYGIQNYVIRPDGKVDVGGSVNLNEKNLTKIPLDFGVVNGNFSIYFNKLTSLEGCPVEVNGNFLCSWNKLTTLEGCPKVVLGSFYCYGNQLTTLEGCPEIVHGGFACNDNKLTTLEHGPMQVNGHFAFGVNPLRNWKWAPEVVTGEIIYSLNIELDSVFKKFLSLNDNDEIIKYVLKEQIYYNIWKRDGSINVPRFKQMMEDSGLKITLPDETP